VGPSRRTRHASLYSTDSRRTERAAASSQIDLPLNLFDACINYARDSSDDARAGDGLYADRGAGFAGLLVAVGDGVVLRGPVALESGPCTKSGRAFSAPRVSHVCASREGAYKRACLRPFFSHLAVYTRYRYSGTLTTNYVVLGLTVVLLAKCITLRRSEYLLHTS
jgi:hypothetical protein